MYEKFLKVRGIFYGILLFSVVGMLTISFAVKKVYVREVMLVPSLEEATQLQSPTIMFFQLSRGFMASPVQIFLDITSPYSFKREFIETYGLDSILDVKNPDKQVKLLESKIELEVLPSASILLKVYDPDPARASRLAKWYVEFLNTKSNYALNVKGRELRKFLETRLKDIRADISELQDSIEAIEREAHILAAAPEEILGPSLSNILETLAQKEVEYVLLSSSFSSDVPEVKKVKREVEILRKKINRKFQELPPAVRKATTYRIELDLKSRVYATLYEEYEKARLMELKNNPMLQAVSPPSGPIKRVWPKRVVPAIAMIVGLSFALLFLLTLFTAFDQLRETTLGRILLSIRRDLLP